MRLVLLALIKALLVLFWGMLYAGPAVLHIIFVACAASHIVKISDSLCMSCRVSSCWVIISSSNAISLGVGLGLILDVVFS